MPINDSAGKLHSEEHLLSIITQVLEDQSTPSGCIMGIGDDALVFTPVEGYKSLITTDIAIEDIHFSKLLSPEDIGYRSMTANLSDCAAMNGQPRYAVVSLGLPPDTDSSYVEKLFQGMKDAARKTECFIGGGDLSRSDKIVLNITLYGESRKPVFRHGAEPGDFIYLTGNTGLSKLGLEIIYHYPDLKPHYPQAVAKHTRPKARNGIMEALVSTYSPTSMIDISDGISTDLGRLMKASGTGAQLDLEHIPLADELERWCRDKGRSVEEYLFSSGEEYEILFTSKKELASQSLKGVPTRIIGRVTHQSSVSLIHGKENQSMVPGHDHFRSIP